MENKTDLSQDGDSLWGARIPIEINPSTGMMTAGDATRPVDVNGDVDVALSSYLSMVYELRSLTTGVIPLREEDIVALADVFEMRETDLAERLARLMHCDDLQTKRFVQMVKKGRVLVPVSMVAAGAILFASLSIANPSTSSPGPVKAQSQQQVEVVTTAPVTQPQVPVVDIGDASQVERAPESVQPAVVDESVTHPAPDVADGEVIVGDSQVVSRDDPAQ